MSETLLAISRSLSADVQTLATISHNVANINTPGYRGLRAVPEFSSQLNVRTALDQGDGAVAQTGRHLDLALQGPGFFVVDRDGMSLLSRAGAFNINAKGQLLTDAGHPVLGTSGPITLSTADVRVDAQGMVWQGPHIVDQLYIVSVTDPGRLKPVGGGAYAYDGQIEASASTVLQGALERSNVDPATQTVQLMEATRHAESVQRAISIYDKAMDVGINRLGDN